MILIEQIGIIIQMPLYNYFDCVNHFVVCIVVQRSCPRDFPQLCQHYHSPSFMKYFTGEKPSIGKATKRAHDQLGTVCASAMGKCFAFPACVSRKMLTAYHVLRCSGSPVMACLTFTASSCAHGDVFT